ncbi:MAG TPA: hypothetical protein VGM81_08060 [Burkholderiaceae bacterium]|jgi:hypothetical protein
MQFLKLQRISFWRIVITAIGLFGIATSGLALLTAKTLADVFYYLMAIFALANCVYITLFSSGLSNRPTKSTLPEIYKTFKEQGASNLISPIERTLSILSLAALALFLIAKWFE